MAHDELPDVDEVGHGVALLHEHLLGVAHPDRVPRVAGRQTPHERRCQRVQRLSHQHSSPVRLTRPQQRHKHLTKHSLSFERPRLQSITNSFARVSRVQS